MSTWRDLKNNPRLKQNYKTRIQILRAIREFFWSQNFIETETPIAVRYPGQEPYLNPIPVLFHDPQVREEKFYLQTSPEFAMKKLLASGFSRIFQICKCFRDYESFGGLHNTEFTMIEWYRVPGRLSNIMDDVENLFKFVSKKLKRYEISEKRYSGVMTNAMGEWDGVSMKELWKKYLDVNLDDHLKIEVMKGLLRDMRYEISDINSYSYEDLFFKIFLNEIEPHLGKERPIFVYDYPARMCSLSRLCEHDNRYAERFELYINGMEIANAFGELTDADEQNKRLGEDRKLREELGKKVYPVDPEFIKALQSGLPKVAGVALGVDRMVMLFTGAKDINEVLFQSVDDQLF